MAERFSIRRLSREIGCSPMTVSLALRGSSKISTAMREKIVAAAAGCRADLAMKSLAGYGEGGVFTPIVAYLNTSNTQVVPKTNRVYHNILRGMKARSDLLGYRVEEFWIGSADLRELPNFLHQQQVIGIVVAPRHEFVTLEEMDFSIFSCLQINFSLRTPRLHRVGNDVFASMVRCFSEICRKGYRRIGLVLEAAIDKRVDRRFSGAFLACQEKLPPGSAQLPVLDAPRISQTELLRWVKRHRPDALISNSVKILEILSSSGIQCPQDIGFVMPFSFPMHYRIAHADGQQVEVGKEAMNVMDSLVLHNECGVPAAPMSHLLEPRWIPGRTLRQKGPPVVLRD